MKIATTTLWIMLCYAFSFGQNIPNTHFTDYPSIFSNEVIKQTNIINVKRLGADNTGKEACDKYVKLALENTRQTGAIIYFPQGEYLLNNTISLSSNQYLAGDGSDLTTLRFDLHGEGHLIQSVGSTFAKWIPLQKPTYTHNTQLVFQNDYIQDGDLVMVRLSETDKTTSDWAKGTVAQISEVSKADSTGIQLLHPLRLDLPLEEKPQIIKLTPQENIGVVNMRIVRKDITTGQTSNIHFAYTKNAIVSGVASDSCNFSHVNNTYSYQNRIESSYFSNAFNYGSGGKAYGVVLSFSSSACMVENNIFNKLRHSVLFQAGPNGNIVGYNYSYNAYWTGVFSPSDFAGDVVMHGNYPFMNLIEGNVIQNLVIDNSHGINGPGNIFLRNRIENAGIFMNCSPATDQQDFIGNEITGTGTSSNGLVPFPRGLYSLCGKGHYEYGNNKNGEILPGKVSTMVSSMYYKETPNYLKTTQIPAIGFPNSLKGNNIPAERRNVEKKKTIDYEFPFDLGPKFSNLKAKSVDIGILVSWEMRVLDECEKFTVYRIVDKQAKEEIATINYGPQMKVSTFNHRDYTYKSDAYRVTYFVEYHDLYGGSFESPMVFVQLKEDPVSVDLVRSDGRGNIFTTGQLQEFTLYDNLGKKVYTIQNPSQSTAIPDRIRNGVYTVSYTKDDVLFYRKKIQVIR